MQKYFYKLLLIPILAFFLMSGCSNSKDIVEHPAKEQIEFNSVFNEIPKSKDIIIAMVPKSLDNPVFLDAKEAAERTGRELGIKVEWLGSMQAESDNQKAIVESLIRRRVDGIIVSCINPESMKEVIDKAIAAGIKVATFDSDAPDSKRIFYCGSNNYKVGEACGDALLKAVRSKNKSIDNLNVLVMTANEGSDNLNQRLAGFKYSAKKNGLKIKVVDTLYCRDDINLAGDLLEKNIQRDQKFDVFFSTGGWPLISPAESMPGFHAWCNDGGISIVIDTFYPILDAAIKGLANSLVGQDFKKMGQLSIMNMYKALKGKEVSSKFIDTGLELGDKSNYKILLQQKTPWEIK